jgi:allophanate hydrolase subunit 1
VTFLWPQLGIHNLQVTEKERLLEEANMRLESLVSQLHQQVDDRDLEGVMNLNMAMASLQIELNTLRITPTWPWEPEVIRILITALALPLGLWLIQIILERFITP